MAKTLDAALGSSAAGSAQSLPVINQTGATLQNHYYERIQDVLPVNRNDLEDLLDFDATAVKFGAFGMFWVSGAFWILIEQFLTQKEFAMTTLTWFCGLCIVIGVFLAYQGREMHKKKRNRIERIFRETKPYNPGTPDQTHASSTGATG